MGFGKRLVNFFIGGSKTVTLDSAKREYFEAFDRFQSCFKDHWSDTTKRANYLDLLRLKLDKDKPASYEKEYKKAIDAVLQSHIAFMLAHEPLNVMESSLKHPSNTTLKRFDEKRDQIKQSVQNNLILSRMVMVNMLKNKAFTNVLYSTISRNSEASQLFFRYFRLAVLQAQYFDMLCTLRSSTKPTSQGSFPTGSPGQSKILEARDKFNELLNQFSTCYDKYWVHWHNAPSETVPPHLAMFRNRINEFKLKGDIDNTQLKLLSIVINSYQHFSRRIFGSLNSMHDSLYRPEGDLKDFDSARDRIKHEVEADYQYSREVLSKLVMNEYFMMAVKSDLDRNAQPLFSLYYALTKAEKEYYDALCQERDRR